MSTDPDPVDDDPGDAPDTFDDRLAAIVRLIDTDGDDPDPARHRARVAIVLALLAHLAADTLARIGAALERVHT